MPAASAGAAPIGVAEARGLFGELANLPRLALAVSGGRDSMGLLRLAARWASEEAGRPRLVALTVDHGLRAESGREAKDVAHWCADIGVPHQTLCWQGPKPRTRIEERAREARYALLTGWCRANGFGAMAVAHHLDDQAETVLMRLSRSSGLDGLAAMTPRSERDGIVIWRPLLGVPRTSIEATLHAFGQSWIDDPANLDRAFARPRLRANRAMLEDVGLEAAAICASAAKLARASHALSEIARLRFSATVSVAPAGYALIDADALAMDPREIMMRVVARAIAVVAGRSRLADAALERICGQIGGDTFAGATLGRCRLSRRSRHVLVVRENRSLPRCRIEPGSTLIWDERFAVTLGAAEPAVELGALGPNGFAALRRTGGGFQDIPPGAGASLPGGYRADTLALAPSLAGDGGGSDLAVRFLRLGAGSAHG